MLQKQSLRPHFKFLFFLVAGIVLLGHIPQTKAQTTPPDSAIDLNGFYWIVRDEGPDRMEVDLPVKVRVSAPGHYRLKGWILYNSGNKQLNESFYMLIRDESGQVFYPLDSNTFPAPYKVVADDSVDGKHRVWRDAGLFYLPAANVDYTIEFHHYATIWDEYPYFLYEQHYEGERNAESLNVNWIGLDYEPAVNGAVSLNVNGAQKQDIGGKSRSVVRPGESYAYDITIRNLEEDVLRGGQLVSFLPDSINVANFSLIPDQVAGRKLTWSLSDIYPGDSLHIVFDATVAGLFPPGYTPLVKSAQLLLTGDSDPSDNRASATVFVFNDGAWPKSPTADIGVSIHAKTDSFQIVNGDTIKYVKPGRSYELFLTLENKDSEDAVNVFLYNQPPSFVSLDNFSRQPDDQSFGYSLWQFAALAPGERITISATATVDSFLITDAFPLTDALMAFSENDADLLNNVAEATVRLAYKKPFVASKKVDLSLSYQAFTANTAVIDGRIEQTISPGDTIRYSLRIRNNGPRDIENVRTWVDVPDSAEFSNFNFSPKYLAFEKQFWFIDHMAASEEREITFEGTAGDTLPFLPFPLPSKGGIYVVTDSTGDNNRDSTRVFVTTEIAPDLVDISVQQKSITDSMVIFNGDAVKFVQSGASYQIEITVSNNSSVAAQNVRLFDLFPDSVAASNFSIAPTTVVPDSAEWLFPTLPANEQRVINFIATVSDSMPVGANWLVNKVAVSADNEDANLLVNNTISDSVLNRVEPPTPELVDVSVSQMAVADSMVVFEGDSVNFVAKGDSYRIEITVNNNSGFEAKNVTLFDIFPDSVAVANFSIEPTTADKDSAVWFFDALLPNDKRVISFTAAVSDSMPVGVRWLVNNVMVYAANEDSEFPFNNASSDSVLNRVEPPSPDVVDVTVSQKTTTDSMVTIDGDSVNFVAAGAAYQIDIMLKNLSAVEVRNVRLVDLFPDSVTVSGFSIDPATVSRDSSAWLFESLSANEQRIISFMATVSGSIPVGERWLINRVLVSADNEDEGRLQNNVSIDSVFSRVDPPLPGKVNLEVTQVAVTDSTITENGVEIPFVAKGEIFEIQITVKNKSNAVAQEVALTEELADLGLLLAVDPPADQAFADSLKWLFEQIDALDQKTVKLDVQLDEAAPPGRHTLNYRASITAANEDAADQSDNVALLTVVNEMAPPPVTARIRSLPPAVDVGDSIHVDVRVDGPVASYSIRAYLADGSVDSTFADNFIAGNPLTPGQWLSVTTGFAIEHLLTGAREEPITFELRAIDLVGKLVSAQTSSMVVSSNYLVLDRNVFRSEEEDFLGIRFKLSYRRQATLDIYDLNGRHVTRVVEDIFDGGWTMHYWNGLTRDGQKVGSGVYLVTLRSGEFNAFKKFILVR